MLKMQAKTACNSLRHSFFFQSVEVSAQTHIFPHFKDVADHTNVLDFGHCLFSVHFSQREFSFTETLVGESGAAKINEILIRISYPNLKTVHISDYVVKKSEGKALS